MDPEPASSLRMIEQVSAIPEPTVAAHVWNAVPMREFQQPCGAHLHHCCGDDRVQPHATVCLRRANPGHFSSSAARLAAVSTRCSRANTAA